MFDKNTILALILIGIILIFIPYYQRMFMSEEELERIRQESTQQKTESVDLKSKETAEVESPVVAEGKKSSEAVESLVETISEVDEQEVIIETPLYRGIISTRGGTIKSWILKKYEKNDGEKIDLIQHNDRGNLGIWALSLDQDSLNFVGLEFAVISGVTDDSLTVKFDESGVGTLLLRADLSPGRSIEKKFTFIKDKYNFDLSLKLNGLQDVIEERAYRLSWGCGLNSTEEDVENDMSYAKVYMLIGSELEDFSVDKSNLEKKEFTGDIRWMAVRTKYFTAAIIPQSIYGKSTTVSGIQKRLDEHFSVKDYSCDLEMPFSGTSEEVATYTVFMGPLQYDIIKNLGVSLEKMMASGWRWIRPISKLIYRSLKFFHKYIPNYGFIIIVFSIIIKILFYPLTHKSYESMRAMQKLQPEMQKLKEKYKDEPQKLNKATMRMYKEQGVNPLGGCLPLLLQMPVFFALYPVFNTMIDFRLAGFIWWIKDLSSPDTVATLGFSIPFYGDKVNILPIIWAISMFIQNMITMKDPKQKMMVYFMPIFMLMFFNRLSSGLVLYWTVFNIFSMIQQYLIGGKKPSPDSKELPKKEKKDPKKLKRNIPSVGPRWMRRGNV